MPSSNDSDLRRQLRTQLLTLPPRAFELFSGDLLEFMGLHDVAVTRYSGDGGIDAVGSLETSAALISIPTGVQVKRYRANVQRADIDRFIGALHGQYAQGIFITTASYSRQAALKAAASIHRIATIDGDQVVALMLQHRLGVTELAGTISKVDEEYFSQFEIQATVRSGRVNEPPVLYEVKPKVEPERVARSEDDLISLRALSHTLRIDTTALRRWIEKGHLRADQTGTHGGIFFRRDRIEAIRTDLLGKVYPTNADEWRQEFLRFARSRNMSRSYKPVLLKALLEVVDRNGEAHIDALTTAFRAFYLARRQAGLTVEFGPPDPSDTLAVNDIQLRQLIVKNPLERFLIKGFLEYTPEEGVVRFAPQLWADLRFWELLEVEQNIEEQLTYYYGRPR